MQSYRTYYNKMQKGEGKRIVFASRHYMVIHSSMHTFKTKEGGQKGEQCYWKEQGSKGIRKVFQVC